MPFERPVGSADDASQQNGVDCSQAYLTSFYQKSRLFFDFLGNSSAGGRRKQDLIAKESRFC